MKRMMVFVDGSNLLVEFARELGVNFRADKPLAEAINAANWLINPICVRGTHEVIRRYWFSSYKGNEEDDMALREILRKNHFEPMIFKKKADGREKGVDIALATEMLVNAFHQNFDLGLLIAGDEDYSELVKEVKRYGPIIWGSFFSHGLSPSLRIAVDMFIDIMLDHEASKNKNYLSACDELFKVLKKK